MTFRLPCQAISDTVTTLPLSLGIVDARVKEDAIWTLPEMNPAGSLRNSVMSGELLIVRNVTAQNVVIAAHPVDNIDGFRDVTVPAESSLIMTAFVPGMWSILVCTQLNMMTSNSTTGLLPGTTTGTTSSGTTGMTTPDTTSSIAQMSSAQLMPQAQGADRRANMPMTRVRGLVKKV